MGIALRTRLPLGLDLPSTVWKSLLEQPLDVSDLESIDKLCVQALSEIGKLDARSYASMFNEQKFVTQLSDHSEFELRKGGRDTLVSYEAREEFTKLSIDARLQESSKQIASIKKGLHSVVPLSNLALFTSITSQPRCTHVGASTRPLPSAHPQRCSVVVLCPSLSVYQLDRFAIDGVRQPCDRRR